MRRITRDNYQQWALDYIEGTLGGELHRQFEGFLAENPDIAGEVGDLKEEMPVLPDTEWIGYPHKEQLLRPFSSARGISVSGKSSASDGASGACGCGSAPQEPLRPRRRRLLSYVGGGAAAAVMIGLFLMIAGLPETASEAGKRAPRPVADRTDSAATAAQPKEAGKAVAALIPQEGSGAGETLPEMTAPAAGTTLPAEVQERGATRYENRVKTPAAEQPAMRNEGSSAETAGAVAKASAGAEAQPAESAQIGEEAPDEREFAPILTGDDRLLAFARFDEPATEPADGYAAIGIDPELAEWWAHNREPVSDETSKKEGKFAEAMRKGVSRLLIPLDYIIPVERFETNEKKGIEIASIIRITRKTQQND